MAADAKQEQQGQQKDAAKPSSPSSYKGFVAGVFSGMAKLAGKFHKYFIFVPSPKGSVGIRDAEG